MQGKKKPNMFFGEEHECSFVKIMKRKKKYYLNIL